SDNVVPLLVAMADHRRERLLRDALRQDNVVIRVRRLAQPVGIERRGITGVHVATAREEGIQNFVPLFDDNRLEVHFVGTEVIGQIELGGGAWLDTNRGAV